MKADIQTELVRVKKALTHGGVLTDKQYCELYAVQQALAWALDPEGADEPYDVVMDGLVQAPIRETMDVGIPEDLAGCQVAPHQ